MALERMLPLNRVIASLTAAVEKLQLAERHQNSREPRARGPHGHSTTQVDLLRTALTTLADAVLEELEASSAEHARIREQQRVLCATVAGLELRLAEERQGERQHAARRSAAREPGSALQARAHNGGGAMQQQLLELKCDMQLLQSQVDKLESGRGLRGEERRGPVQAITRLDSLEPRLAQLAASLEATNKASRAQVAALEDKMEGLASSQARHINSVESVVRTLVDETASLARSTRSVDLQLASQQAQLQDTKEALLRSAQVFSHLLKVPTPVCSPYSKLTTMALPPHQAVGTGTRYPA